MANSVPGKEIPSQAAYGRDEVIKIINSVLAKAQTNDTGGRDALLGELQELKKIIEDAQQELNSARPGEIQDKHLPTATDELDAVVGATEEATGVIMDSCEVIQGEFDNMDAAVAGKVEEAVTRIFEACSFQDITGQRIAKVMGSLAQIEDKVGKIMGVLDNSMPGLKDSPAASEESDDSLVNGPQMPDQAVSQDDIDKILAEFGD